MIEYTNDQHGRLSQIDPRFRENAIAWRLGVAMGLWKEGDVKVAVDPDALFELAEGTLLWASEKSNLSELIKVDRRNP